MLTFDCLVCAVLGSTRVDVVYSLLVLLTYYQFVANIVCGFLFPAAKCLLAFENSSNS